MGRDKKKKTHLMGADGDHRWNFENKASGYYSFLESDFLVHSSGVPARPERALC